MLSGWSRDGMPKCMKQRAGGAMDEVLIQITAIHGTGEYKGTSGEQEQQWKLSRIAETRQQRQQQDNEN